MFHVWPLIRMPEARRARSRIVSFLEDWAAMPSPVRSPLPAKGGLEQLALSGRVPDLSR
jgi:hypothetical protein